MQGYSCSETNKIKYSKQILQKVIPLVKKLNEDQMIEKEIEAKVKGVSIPELQLQDANCEVDDDIFCDNCGSYSFDFYRSCACGYDLCLACCRELRDGQLKVLNCGWKPHTDGSIPCPPNIINGCSGGTLELKRIMCVDWIVNLLEKAQRLYKMNYSYDNPEICMESNENHLYSLSVKNIQPQHMQQFQFHWSKGEPIIVNDVVSTSSGLSWDPMVLWRAFRDITKTSNHSPRYEVHAINCLDWSEVTVDLGKFCSGYSSVQIKQGLQVILKLEDWQPSCLSQGELPRHFVEFINCLPFKDYTNPENGYLNFAVKLPDQSLKPNMGPKMDIAYGIEEELGYGDSVTKLHYEKSDTVNVLTHTQKHSDQHEDLVCEAGPQRFDGQQYVVDPMETGVMWDVFKRQDVPKLEKYLKSHLAEFRHSGCVSNEQVFHPIHDRTCYLNMEHKRKLKEEFGIEPWTFKQKLGDAIFIPAGCPYQVRNLKSSTKVELNFISPESLNECIRLQNEIRMLPKNHRAKQQKLNIGKMMIHALEQAVTELSRFKDSNGHTNDLQDQYTKQLDILIARDGTDINNHTNGWVCDSESDDDSQIEDSDTSEESLGTWQGNLVGHVAKELLDSVENRYPETFQTVEIRSKPYWLSILKELHVFIKGFLEASVDELSEDQIINLEADLNDFEKFGFNLLWARKRLNMVKNLKFGNDQLRLELVVLEESLKSSRIELVEANARLEKARLDYETATDARNKKVDEVALKFGGDYNDVLNGNLGLGLLPGY